MGLGTSEWLAILLVELLPVVSELTLPVEVVDVVDSGLNESFEDGATMHIEHDQSTHHVAFLLAEVTTDQVNHTCQLLIRELEELLEGRAVLTTHNLVNSAFNASGPLHLIDDQDALSGAMEEPFITLTTVFGVDLHCISGDHVERHKHGLLNVVEPGFDGAVGEARFVEIDNFSFRRIHRDDLFRVLFPSELNPLNRVKALVEEGLYSLGVPGLRQDLDELVIGQEEETGERCSLSGQVVL
jgi:hypothetical protein